VKITRITKAKVTHDGIERGTWENPRLSIDQIREILTELISDPRILAGVKREFDRSMVMSVDVSANGRPLVMFSERDYGNEVMTVADVAAFLQTDRRSVRRLTGERARRRSHHPIPFVKIGGKMLRFSRPAVEAWWAEICASENGKNNTSALALPKGKSKR
jgi:hypothetical protein